MSARKRPGKLTVDFPTEVDQDKARYSRTPIQAVADFLEHFDDRGVMRSEVSIHKLEFLAARFHEFMTGSHNSLDAAFGGRVARQRNQLSQQENDERVYWDYLEALRHAQSLNKESRSQSTPTEFATAEIAEMHEISEDTVRDICKRLGRVR